MHKHDLGTLAICALRYCHHRRSYMPSVVQDIVEKSWDHFDVVDQQLMMKDVEDELKMGQMGSKYDNQGWISFLGRLQDMCSPE